MKKNIICAAVFFLFLCAAVFLPAQNISINGDPSTVLTRAEFEEVSRNRPVGGRIRRSVALEELLPVFVDLEALTVIGDSRYDIPSAEGDSVLPLYRTYLTLEGDGSCTVFVGGVGKQLGEDTKDPVVTNVRDIRIEGELLTSGELEVWVAWEGVPELKREIQRWSRIHGMKVVVNEVPKSDSKLLSVLRGGGDLPDVVLVQSDYLPSLTAAGALQPMVRFPVDQFAEKSLEAMSLDGRLWAVPFYFDAQLLFYRSDLVSRRAVSDIADGWDLDDFERIARQLKARGISPASWNAYSAYWLASFQLGFGKEELLGPDGTVRVDDQATFDAVSYLKRIADEGLLDLRERDSMFSRFISGDVAMMLSASFSIPELERIGVPFGVASFPDGPAGPVAPLLDFKGFSITRKTRNPLLARRFLLSMSDPAVQHSFTSDVYKIPVAEPAWVLAEEENPYFQVLRNAYDTGVAVPSTRGYTIYKNTMWKMLRFLLTGKMPVQEGLEQAQTLIDNQMKE